MEMDQGAVIRLMTNKKLEKNCEYGVKKLREEIDNGARIIRARIKDIQKNLQDCAETTYENGTDNSM